MDSEVDSSVSFSGRGHWWAGVDHGVRCGSAYGLLLNCRRFATTWIVPLKAVSISRKSHEGRALHGISDFSTPPGTIRCTRDDGDHKKPGCLPSTRPWMVAAIARARPWTVAVPANQAVGVTPSQTSTMGGRSAANQGRGGRDPLRGAAIGGRPWGRGHWGARPLGGAAIGGRGPLGGAAMAGRAEGLRRRGRRVGRPQGGWERSVGVGFQCTVVGLGARRRRGLT
jgi:hypothetical protein